jgi:hypothetical protein
VGAIYTVKPFTTLSIEVSETPILAETRLDGMAQLLFAFINDGVFPCDVTIQSAERSGTYDGEYTPTLTVAPGEQRSLQITENIRKFYRVAGVANGGATSLAWQLRSILRGAK